MTLRKKTAFIVIVTLAGLIIALYATLSSILLDGFADVETQNTHRNVERVLDAFANDLAKLKSVAGDWAAWDDTYRFIQDGNDNYIKSNLVDETFIELRLNLLLFINSSGQIVFGKGFDLDKKEAVPAPESLHEHLAINAPLLQRSDPTSILAGIVSLPEGPLLVVAHPILTSEGQGPIGGTLIMGRSLDATEIERLAQLTHLSVTVYRIDDAQMPPDLQMARSTLSDQAPIHIQPLGDDLISGYTWLKDIYGQPALLLRVEIPRIVYQQGQESVRYLLASLLLVGLVFGAMTLLLLEKSVLSRLARLGAAVSSIGASGDLSTRVPTSGEAELSSLAIAINQMLEALERSQRALQESEERYRHLVDLAPDGIIVHSEGKIVFVNPAGMNLAGATSPEQVLGRSLLDFVHPAYQSVVRSRVRQMLEEGKKVPLLEEKLLRLDGTVLDVEVATCSLTYRGKPGLQVIVRDITERKRAERLERDRNSVLEMVAKGEPLASILLQLVQMIERQSPRALCSISWLQEGRLHCQAGPRFPKSFIQALDGLAIGPNADSCGPAAYRGETVIVSDIATDPLWAEYRELALGQGLRACWAVPILSAASQVLGTVAMYDREPHAPNTDDLALLEMASHLAAIAIEQRQLANQLAHQAQHDSLTGLPNRMLFEDRLQQAIALAGRNQQLLALLFIDLDGFKMINDTLGHAIGDALLRQVARRLESHVRGSDTIARMGGDEFTLVATELKDPQAAARVAQKLLDALKAPFEVEGHELFVTGSIGISLYPSDGEDMTELLRKADSAMYRAKAQGKNEYQFYTVEVDTATLERLTLERELYQALEQGELELFYQPQLDLRTGKLVGLEALLRWQHLTLGMITPATFISMAEEAGLIFSIGSWALNEACRQNKAWQEAGYPPLRVAVNVSASQFARPDFVQATAAALEQSGLEPHLLELELTESMLIHNTQDTTLKLAELRLLGVHVSIDDFDTGYSSLTYLQRLPIDTLKIDRSFVRDIGLNPETGPDAIVKAITTLAHSLRMRVVAEGVETREQLEFLRRINCDGIQGFLISRPLPAAEIEARFLKTAGTFEASAELAVPSQIVRSDSSRGE